MVYKTGDVRGRTGLFLQYAFPCSLGGASLNRRALSEMIIPVFEMNEIGLVRNLNYQSLFHADGIWVNNVLLNLHSTILPLCNVTVARRVPRVSS